MSKRVLILHGLSGSDFPHWQAHLASDLIKERYIVSFPELPNKNSPSLNEWKNFLKEEINHFKPNIVVCHSLANILWFHTCDELDIKLDKLMLVAPVRNKPLEEAKSFFPYPIAKELKAKEIIIAASTNDPYMSLEEAIELQSKLNVGMKIMENAGHINPSSGFGKLDCALDWIKRVEQCEENL
ncbi:alpha/beta hydrolase [Aliarcobacter skirrowii]|jgi:predicted alpha/beta hydrolase family esterase|uniref:Alpha/beta hydrolase n=1 Tax=Aliarcobacter skirrowii TaxID=28200 RepID=A0AAW9D816_9BACT|nr:alpha/beta hydrolase [Aliarcobacter skirrowii]MDX4059111.1 alpha/beta hydrolase [Aliarcobacter skirrowii]MDX4061270.1 alpha/beta hydrolase [Aliarcobacter skirrowii]MDX4068330.1 alpha/beta hydrolase [Aliarcobacter skirrowii]